MRVGETCRASACGRSAQSGRSRKQSLPHGVQCEGVALEQDAISRIESGQRMVQDYELRALAEVLGASMDWLAGKE